MEAKRYFEMAREAVDKYFRRVSESPQLRAYGAEQLRRDLMRDARDYYEQFVQIQSTDPELQGERGRASFMLASLTAEIGSMTEAISLAQQALDILAPLRNDRPNIAKYGHLRARALHLLANLYQDTNQIETAKEAYGKSLSIYEQLGLARPDVPDYRDGQAGVLTDLGNLHRLRNYWYPTDSAKFYQEALPIRKQLADIHPEVAEYQDGLARTLHALGNLHSSTASNTKSEQTVLAQSFYEQALPIREHLARVYPTIADFQERLASTLAALGHVYKVNRKEDQARESYERALFIRQEMLRIHPDVSSYQAGLVRTTHDLGRFYYDMEQFSLAKETIAKGLPIAEELARRQPEVPNHHYWLTTLRLLHARTLAQLGEHVQAAKVADFARNEPSISGDNLASAACVYALCSAAARTDEKNLPADRDKFAERYTASAVEALEKAHRSGYFTSKGQLELLNRYEDLAPIRSDGRFIQFMQEARKAFEPPPKPNPSN
jgi:tetratricopeptide (TPR) repeat protein